MKSVNSRLLVSTLVFFSLTAIAHSSEYDRWNAVSKIPVAPESIQDVWKKLNCPLTASSPREYWTYDTADGAGVWARQGMVLAATQSPSGDEYLISIQLKDLNPLTVEKDWGLYEPLQCRFIRTPSDQFWTCGLEEPRPAEWMERLGEEPNLSVPFISPWQMFFLRQYFRGEWPHQEMVRSEPAWISSCWVRYEGLKIRLEARQGERNPTTSFQSLDITYEGAYDDLERNWQILHQWAMESQIPLEVEAQIK